MVEVDLRQEKEKEEVRVLDLEHEQEKELVLEEGQLSRPLYLHAVAIVATCSLNAFDDIRNDCYDMDSSHLLLVLRVPSSSELEGLAWH